MTTWEYGRLLHSNKIEFANTPDAGVVVTQLSFVTANDKRDFMHVSNDPNTVDEISTALDSLGREGWEAVGFTSNTRERPGPRVGDSPRLMATQITLMKRPTAG